MKRRSVIRRKPVSLAVLLLAVLMSACSRRELYVYGDEYHSVALDVDWSDYSAFDPDGMTVWFYPLDRPDHAPYRYTTANVLHYEFYLPGGMFSGMVIDYSPEEYSRQRFLSLDTLQTSRVEATLQADQPDSLTVAGPGVPANLSRQVNLQLFGDAAWTDLQQPRPALSRTTGLYGVANQPEPMGLDTLVDRSIDAGAHGDYIPWQERDTYQQTLRLTQLYAVPQSIVWTMRVRIRIRSGISNMWQTPASLSGLADGRYLMLNEPTDNPCLIAVNDWSVERQSDGSGYISTTLTSFGLRPSQLERESLRLNLSFVLRDHSTTLHYHFNVGDQVVRIDDRLELRLDLDTDIDLPYVDAYNGAGFGADVTPWEDEDPVDVHF